jgi:hypothetical protein
VLVAWRLLLVACSLPPTTGLRDSASFKLAACGWYNHKPIMSNDQLARFDLTLLIQLPLSLIPDHLPYERPISSK